MTVEQLSSAVAQYPHGRVPRGLRRQQVMAVATALFIERGYDATSMDELARRVGVSKPVIYEIVGSKQDLFRDVMAQEAEDLAGRIAKAVEGEPRPEERLRAGALAFFRFVGERRPAWSTLVAAEAVPVAAEIQASRRLHAKLVAGLLARGAADLGGEVDATLIDACAHAINGAFEALALWWSEHPDVTAETLAELLTRMVTPGLVALSSGFTV